MERIQAQADKLWKLLTDPNTYGTYRNAIQTTWNILRETALLIGLILFLAIVLLEWFYKTAVSAGRNFRTWFNNLGSSDQVATEAGKALLSAGKNSLDFTIATAKSQLGLPVEKSE